MKKRKIDWSKLAKTAVTSAKRKSPAILIGAGLVSGVVAVVTAVKATEVTTKQIEQATKEKITQTGDENAKLDVKEKVQIAWKYYIPVLFAEATSIVCIIFSGKISSDRAKSLAASCALLSASNAEYTNKVIETIGEKKEAAIRQAIVEDEVHDIQSRPQNIVRTGNGDVLCVDVLSGREFYSSRESLRESAVKLNETMIKNGGMISINDWYDEIGLPHTVMGDHLYWCLDTGMIELKLYDPIMSADGRTPCIAVKYKNLPGYNYNEIGW